MAWCGGGIGAATRPGLSRAVFADRVGVRRAGHWTAIEDPTYYRTNATADQAKRLAIPPGEPLLTREAIQQVAGIRRYHRLHMPFSVAEHTPWADDPHLPPAPKVHEHFTAHGHTLTRTEHVRARARAPIGDETQLAYNLH